MVFEKLVFIRGHFVIADLEHAHLILRDKINTPREGRVVDFSDKESRTQVLDYLRVQLQNIKKAREFDWND
jgi:hypothetical protein